MRYLKLAAIIACASLVASCAPFMTTYPFPQYGFTINFPSPPKVEDTSIPQAGAQTAVINSESVGREFAVTITDVGLKGDIDVLSEADAEATAKTVGGVVTYRSGAATAEGALGRELVVSKDGRREVRARYYRSGTRFYVLAFRSRLGITPDTEHADPSIESGSDNDPAAQAFLNSFHFTAATSS